MGLLSGTLVLQGNPAGLLNSSIFKSTDSLDIHGLGLDEDGEPVSNVSIELVDPDSESAIKSSMSDENGRYVIDSVLVKEYELHVTKQGYQTVILSFKPEPIGISPITMVVGEGERTKDELSQTQGWSMENAVALATANKNNFPSVRMGLLKDFNQILFRVFQQLIIRLHQSKCF